MKTILPFLFLLSILFLSCSSESYDNDIGITVPDGFRVEKLVTPQDAEMGSWVSLAHVEDNRFVASDQYGEIYWVEAPKIGSKGMTKVEPLEVEVGKVSHRRLREVRSP